VYRTYVLSDGVATAADAAYIKQAVEVASQRRGVERELMQALGNVFLVAPPASSDHGIVAVEKVDLRKRFVTQFQQLTGAVMAKGCEDTAFYRYLRLTALVRLTRC
jgi:(1->4)-alpha-D-glucan 1-alpha-D-glucosylmutase